MLMGINFSAGSFLMPNTETWSPY